MSFNQGTYSGVDENPVVSAMSDFAPWQAGVTTARPSQSKAQPGSAFSLQSAEESVKSSV